MLASGPAVHGFQGNVPCTAGTHWWRGPAERWRLIGLWHWLRSGGASVWRAKLAALLARGLCGTDVTAAAWCAKSTVDRF